MRCTLSYAICGHVFTGSDVSQHVLHRVPRAVVWSSLDVEHFAHDLIQVDIGYWSSSVVLLKACNKYINKLIRK
jgi:hypothetical protein